jgi:translation initiation factor eIF-2B subunit alpha
MKAAETKHFDIIILEGRPDGAGARAAKFYAEHNSNIPTTVVLDSAIGYVMESVDIVLTGAEAVVENGGCVNKMGTYTIALCAQAHGKPFYVASESYKFARLYPLNQRDLPNMGNVPLKSFDTTRIHEEEESKEMKEIILPENVKVDNPPCDYTPAKFITLLFTDLGVLTPSAVSDELIRLYQ